ncbi:hypothetical protein PYW08_000378 [Mythimna loreyi]|uniref:Uncharacterized protein n=1 Tax=Mythimna loreyi TaxID=667449 RepID=A0ACC2RCA0_9NEOP|nr:hypothetical protein PYW08_000378 [Mythimna loreyi]
MAVKALHGDQLSYAEASNDNYQYAEAPPSPSTPVYEATVATTTAPSHEYYNIQGEEVITTEATSYETRPRNTPMDQNSDVLSPHKEHKPRYKILALQTADSQDSEHYYNHSADASSTTGKLKYGDKI